MAYNSKKKDSMHFYAYNEAKREGVNFDKSPYQITNEEYDTLMEIAKDIGYKKSKSSKSNLGTASAFFEYLKKKYHK